jgi:hypothetical protein
MSATNKNARRSVILLVGLGAPFVTRWIVFIVIGRALERAPAVMWQMLHVSFYQGRRRDAIRSALELWKREVAKPFDFNRNTP